MNNTTTFIRTMGLALVVVAGTCCLEGTKSKNWKGLEKTWQSVSTAMTKHQNTLNLDGLSDEINDKNLPHVLKRISSYVPNIKVISFCKNNGVQNVKAFVCFKKLRKIVLDNSTICTQIMPKSEKIKQVNKINKIFLDKNYCKACVNESRVGNRLLFDENLYQEYVRKNEQDFKRLFSNNEELYQAYMNYINN